MQPAWNVEAASVLWTDLSRSTRAIADEVGVSHNTLCSYAKNHRDLFPRREANNKGINTYSLEKRAAYRDNGWERKAGAKPSPRPSRAKAASGPGLRPVSVITLPGLPSVASVRSVPAQAHSHFQTCQWLSNEPPYVTAPPLWCGAPTRPGAAYCEHHYRICYTQRAA